jgi:hypothetical protein
MQDGVIGGGQIRAGRHHRRPVSIDNGVVHVSHRLAVDHILFDGRAVASLQGLTDRVREQASLIGKIQPYSIA